LLLNKVTKSTIKGLRLELGSRAGLGAIRPYYCYYSITFAIYSCIDCY
jgi:hypothetical protein